MINVGIVGISGYSGCEVLNILQNHSDVRVTYVSANNSTGALSDIWPQFANKFKLKVHKFNVKEAVEAADLFFLAVPHKTAMTIAPKLLKEGKKVIDLSGDYRLDNANKYKKWYKTPHTDVANLKTATYGLPELYRAEIKNASLIANPGCYPTAAILGLAPLVAAKGSTIKSIIIDAKSGATGAGRKTHLSFSFAEANENFKAYKPLKHQHVPEMELYLSKLDSKLPPINFVPHLLPCDRGILETIYVQVNKKLTSKSLHQLYKRFYKTDKFVRIMPEGKLPELKNVAHTNFCDIGLTLNDSGKLLVITSAIDNLQKGAAGQAVQNMNIMCGYKETTAL